MINFGAFISAFRTNPRIPKPLDHSTKRREPTREKAVERELDSEYWKHDAEYWAQLNEKIRKGP